MNFGRGSQIAQNNDIVENGDSWISLTPPVRLCLPRSAPVPVEMPATQRIGTWQDLLEMYSEILNYDVAIKKPNPSSVTSINGRNFDLIGVGTEANQHLDRNAGAYVQNFSNDSAGSSNNKAAEVNGIRTAGNYGLSNGQRNNGQISIRHSHSNTCTQVTGNWKELESTSLMGDRQHSLRRTDSNSSTQVESELESTSLMLDRQLSISCSNQRLNTLNTQVGSNTQVRSNWMQHEASMLFGKQKCTMGSNQRLTEASSLQIHNMLLQDTPTPSNMDKSRIMFVAQKRGLKEDGSKDQQSQGDNAPAGHQCVGTVAQPVVGSLISKELAEGSHKKRRTVKIGTSEALKKKKADTGFNSCSGLRDEDSDVEILPQLEKDVGKPRSEGGVLGDASLGFLANNPPLQEGTERQTLLKFQTGQGCLGAGLQAVAPVEALGAFALSPDKEGLGKKWDEEILEKAKEAFGVFGTYFMDVVERVHRIGERATVEHSRAIIEQMGRDEALGLVRAAHEKEEVRRELERERKEKDEAQGRLLEFEENLQAEKAVSESLRSELEKLKREVTDKAVELDKAVETLEKVEKEADITYQDCVKKFQESQEFIEMVEVKAREYHEIGYDDCLGFVGAGNVVDLEVHSVVNFRDFEIARLEKEKAEAEKRVREEEAAASEAQATTQPRATHASIC